MEADRIERVIRELDSLPTLPAVATRLLQMIARDSPASVAEVSRIVEGDQALTARILRLANSPLRGVGRPIGTVAEAVVVLGFKAVHNNVLSMQVFDIFATPSKAALDRKAFWKHALAVGCCAELLAEGLGAGDPDEAFVAGLLHDIGKVALDYCFPEEFARAMQLVHERGMSSLLAEQREIGADHAFVGRHLAEHWHLPQAAVQVIWLHHQPLTPVEGAIGPLLKIVHVSDVIVSQQHIGLDEGRPLFFASDTLLADLRLTPHTLGEIARTLRQRIEARARIMGLEDADEISLFVEAIQAANRQLGRINQRLNAAAAELHRRLKRFAALNAMNTRILPAAGLEQALATAAETLRECFAAEEAVCYVCDEARRAIAAAVHPSGAPEAEVVFLPWPAPARGEADAPPSETWVLRQLKRAFDTGHVYTVPLTVDGRTIGAAILHTRADFQAATVADQVTLSAIISTVALALGKVLLRDHLRRQTDQLARANRDLQETYAQLLETQKLKAVATLAAGAAHEINNPLAIISGRAQFLKSREPDPKKQQELDLIAEQSTRISRIINELMAYARPAEPSIRSADLNALAEQMVTELTPGLADRRIALTSRPASDLPRVQTDPDLVRTLVGGLVVALADALETGAAIEVSTHAPRLADTAELRVASVGAALPRESLPSLFEPFFSVSLHGQGFGLAFAKCQSGIKKLGGDIWVDDQDEQSTRFRILLPVAG